ncbi:MAG TPA: hypothetical protein QGF37_01485 [Candidatus Pelagibacter bacterium]|nr:hypothetical protein [Candidatus Pelagibacter bacterium]
MNELNIKLRSPAEVMKLSRLGSFHQSKLSFLRSFIKEFKDWNYKRNVFDLDKDGYGIAVYSLEKNKKNYSLVCFANYLNSEERSDRVIANKWDTTFVLHDGIPTLEDLERLKKNVPKQEAGRVTYKELSLARANKSVRIFDHVVDSLSQGKQPDKKLLSKVGYLYRTTAVYGSGKCGLADRFRIKNRKEICGPFRLEMMLVYLVRQFTFDQVNHIAKLKNPNKAMKLNNDIARNLGIGNSTGLGLAPFIINHPILLNNWIYCREKALKEIRSIEKIKVKDFNIFLDCLNRSKVNINTWLTESDYQKNKIKSLKSDLKKFNHYLEKNCSVKTQYLWNEIYTWAESKLSIEGIEYIVSMIMEPYNNIVDPLINEMSAEEEKYFTIPAHRKLKEVKKIIENNYKFLIKIDYEDKKNITNFWFISKNKAEPRIANRHQEHGSELEQPLAIGRDVKQLYHRILKANQNNTVAEFLLYNDDLRHIVRRVFIVEQFPYSEIQDNIIGASLVPIDLLRLKLSFFGSNKFDPKSDKWLRINMYQGAPLPQELKSSNDTWIYNSLS